MMSDPSEESGSRLKRKEYLEGRLDGDFCVEIVRAWALDRARSSGKQTAELGKFFFGVSSFFIGLVIAMVKFSGYSDNVSSPTVTHSEVFIVSLCFSLLGFLVSAGVAISMVIPRHLNFGADTVLPEEMRKQNSGHLRSKSAP